MKIGISMSAALAGVLVSSAVAAPAGRTAFPADVLALASQAQDLASGDAPVRFDSFRMQVSRRGKATGTAIVDVVHDASEFIATGADGRVRRMYTVRGMSYTQGSDGEWQRLDLSRPFGSPEPRRNARAAPRSHSVGTKLPDRRIGGRVYAVYRYRRTPPEAQRPAVTCLVDKTSGFLRRCNADDGSYAFAVDRYNDAANVVAVPAAALRARTVTFP